MPNHIDLCVFAIYTFIFVCPYFRWEEFWVYFKGPSVPCSFSPLYNEHGSALHPIIPILTALTLTSHPPISLPSLSPISPDPSPFNHNLTASNLPNLRPTQSNLNHAECSLLSSLHPLSLFLSKDTDARDKGCVWDGKRIVCLSPSHEGNFGLINIIIVRKAGGD